MNKDKDPVLAQIESDARKAVKEYPSALSLMYEAGAHNQDAIAWNRCLDDQESVHMDKILKAMSRLNNENLPREHVVALESAITYAKCTIEYLKKNRI